MSDENKNASERETGGQQERRPLPIDFFAELLDLPTCKTDGYCNDCGRCER